MAPTVAGECGGGISELACRVLATSAPRATGRGTLGRTRASCRVRLRSTISSCACPTPLTQRCPCLHLCTRSFKGHGYMVSIGFGSNKKVPLCAALGQYARACSRLLCAVDAAPHPGSRSYGRVCIIFLVSLRSLVVLTMPLPRPRALLADPPHAAGRLPQVRRQQPVRARSAPHAQPRVLRRNRAQRLGKEPQGHRRARRSTSLSLFLSCVILCVLSLRVWVGLVAHGGAMRCLRRLTVLNAHRILQPARCHSSSVPPRRLALRAACYPGLSPTFRVLRARIFLYRALVSCSNSPSS